MRTFTFSVFVGACVGITLGIIFIFAKGYISESSQATFAQKSATAFGDVQNIFQKKETDESHYFISKKEHTFESEQKVVYSDLGEMKIKTVVNGELVAEYPIKSIGREGTAWQTPIGTFDMNYKKPNHFSSLGHVYMPWSMHFFGNYFIHGWPYYPDGTLVAEGYSGGCIRMATEDAKSIYDFIDSDTELVVLNSDNEIESPLSYEYKITQKAPQLEANFLVADIKTGEVVAVHNQNEIIEDSSFSKLMTAIISLESLNQYTDVSFGGVIQTIGDVLYPLLLTNDNSAEEFLFDFKNKNQFEVDMNNRAKSIGMQNTTYLNPLDEEFEQTTLEDTFRLVQYIAYYKPFLITVLGLPEYTKGESANISKHPLLLDENFVAGFGNENKSELLTIVDVNLGGSGDNSDTERFIILVENSPDIQKDSKTLLEWLKVSVEK